MYLLLMAAFADALAAYADETDISGQNKMKQDNSFPASVHEMGNCCLRLLPSTVPAGQKWRIRWKLPVAPIQVFCRMF
jgi:hypothetical protein